MKLLIAGGGTGGHIFPAIAIAEALKAQNQNNEILFVGTEAGLEAKIIPALGFPIQYIPKAPLVGTSLLQKLKTITLLPKALSQAKKIIREFNPQAVLGVGGYASAPVVYAARRKLPTFLLEQNAVPGLTNRVLSYLVNYVFISFPSTEDYFPKQTCELTGNPVRKNILNVATQKKEKNVQVFNIFVMGGSQGAHFINLTVIEALDYFKKLPKKTNIVHQTGHEDLEMVKKEYAEKKVNAEIIPFIDDVAPYLAEADLVIGRAGAGTVSELIVTQTPSILIPYPYAKSHQVYNAEELGKKGATRVVLQQDISGEKLVNIIKQMMTYEQVLEKMKEALKEFNWGNPAEKIVNFITTHLEK